MDQLLPHSLRDVIDDDLARAHEYPAGPEPWVRANMVGTLDGVAALDGVSAGLSGADDKRLFAVLRDLADVVLVGAGTVRKEGYGPAELSARRRARRLRWTGPDPVPYAVVTNSGLDPDLSFFRPLDGVATPIVITHADAADHVPVDRSRLIVAGQSEVDLALAIPALAELGLRRVLCEGGPGLLSSLLRAGLLDELCLTVAPMLLGPGAGPGLIGTAELPGPVRWELAGLHSGTDELFARYRRGRTTD